MARICTSMFFLPRAMRRHCGLCLKLSAGAMLWLLAACAASSLTADEAGRTHDSVLGAVLAGSDGMTLYTYDKDIPGVSRCAGLCAVAWPPVTGASADSAKDGFTVITRPDGSLQWAYRDQPLYSYIRDSAPGDVAGDGVDGVWHVAKP